MLSDEKIIAIAKQTGMLHPVEQEMHDACVAYTRAIEAAVLAEQAKEDPVHPWRKRRVDEHYEARPLYLHPAPAPEGMVMVPREPTEAILKAARDTADKHLAGDYSNEECTTDAERADKSNRDYWLAMIAAATKEE